MKKIVFIAALSVGLAGCETMNSMTKGIDDAFASVNEAMGAGPIADTPAQICSEMRSNHARAVNKYSGKTVEVTGKLVAMEQNTLAEAMSGMNSKVWGSAKQFDVRVSSGPIVFSSLINRRTEQLNVFNMGDTVTIKGRVRTIGKGKSCTISLEENMSIKQQ